MNKWHREILKQLKQRQLKVVDWRSGGHHDVITVMGKDIGFNITVSLSPRSIEQAARNFGRNLDRRLEPSKHGQRY